MTRLLVFALAFLALTPSLASAATRITAVDAAEYPLIRLTVVTPRATAPAPILAENGQAVTEATEENLGHDKGVVLAIDRSQSMRGRPLGDAVVAAQRFVAMKPISDRIAILTFASRVIALTGFSSATIDADSALRTIAVDSRYGTGLYDAVARSARMLRGQARSGRVIILVTDGQETTSSSTLRQAIQAARSARVSVYPVAIESNSFSPKPLRQIARSTGGRYYGAASSSALTDIYAKIARELRRTWRIEYPSRARPGDSLSLRVAVRGAGAAVTTIRLPGPSHVTSSNSGPSVVLIAGLALAAGLVLFALVSWLRGGSITRRWSPGVDD